MATNEYMRASMHGLFICQPLSTPLLPLMRIIKDDYYKFYMCVLNKKQKKKGVADFKIILSIYHVNPIERCLASIMMIQLN